MAKSCENIEMDRGLYSIMLEKDVHDLMGIVIADSSDLVTLLIYLFYLPNDTPP